MEVYDRATGYKDVGDINVESLSKSMESITADFNLRQDQDILVIGCGKGDEARVLQKVTGCKVFAIDPEAHEYSDERLTIIKGDASILPWKDDRFDFVLCNHVLEHVDKPKSVLRELLRVLNKESGQYYMAFPNKRRIIPMYWKSHVKITLFEIIKFNLRDLKYRMTGNWENSLGAHAGFSHNDWDYMMSDHESNYIFDSLPKSFPFRKYFRDKESRFPVCLIIPTVKIKKVNSKA